MKAFKQLLLATAIATTVQAQADTLGILRYHHSEVTKHDQLALQALANNLMIVQHHCELAPTDENCEELDRALLAHKVYKDAMQLRYDSRELAIEATLQAVEIMDSLDTDQSEQEVGL